LAILVAGMVSILSGSTDLYDTVAKINKGLDGYIVGKALTKDQQKLVEKNSLASSNKHILKFLANNNMVIAINKDNKRVLAINKRYKNMKQKDIQKMIGKFIFDFDEPTAMAHDKMVYWIYDRNGVKLNEDDLKKWKESIKAKNTGLPLAKAVNTESKNMDFNPYILFKMSSTELIMTKVKDPKPSTINIIVSSDKLIEDTTGIAQIK
jgi:transcriptional regulator with PAS, ATPase and Fis domain